MDDEFDDLYTKKPVTKKGESIKEDLSNRYKSVIYIGVIFLIILIVVYLFSILFSVLHEIVNLVLDGSIKTEVALNSTARALVRADSITHGILIGILLVIVCFPCIIVGVLSMSSETRYVIGNGFVRIISFSGNGLDFEEFCGTLVLIIWIAGPIILQLLIQIKNVVFIFIYHNNYSTGLIIPLLFLYFQVVTFAIIVIGLFVIFVGFAIYVTMNWNLLKADDDVKQTFASNQAVTNIETQEKIKNLALKQYDVDYFRV